jgi:hypothetical protein
MDIDVTLSLLEKLLKFTRVWFTIRARPTLIIKTPGVAYDTWVACPDVNVCSRAGLL